MAFPNESIEKDGVAITDSSLVSQITYRNNLWLFEDSTDLGFWSIDENTSYPYLKNILYSSYVFPNDATVTQNGVDTTNANLKKEETYTNNFWDFITIWAIQENKYYPRFTWEPIIIDSSKFVIGMDVIPLTIFDLQDNQDIISNENKVNSTSVPSHLTFCGAQRRKLQLQGYTSYTNYTILRNAAMFRTSVLATIYQPKNAEICITDNFLWYISNFATNFKLGDGNNFYFSLELTYKSAFVE